MKYLVFQFLIFTTMASFAQHRTSRVLSRNAGLVNNRQTISVKWYAPELYFPEGVNVYKKAGTGAWKKINVKPIKKLDTLSKQEYARDKDLEFFVPVINKGKEADLKGLLLLNVLAKSFESEVFARFLGIQIEDSDIKLGIVYTYKVNRIRGTTESLIGFSSPITAGTETMEEPVKGIVLTVDTNKVKFNWLAEDQRYYAVNVYRENTNKEWIRLNKEPIMISKYRDSLGHFEYPKIKYLDDSLNVGVYNYQLAGVDFFGKDTKRSQALTIEVKDLIPPPAPEAFEDSINNLEVLLTWKLSPSPDIAGVNVYRANKSSGPYSKLNTVLLAPSTIVFKDQVPKAGPYYYYISTIDAAGNESKSQAKFSEVHDIVPPAKALGLMARADTGRVILSWQKNKEADLWGYKIYRTINKGDRDRYVLLNTEPLKESTFMDNLPINAKNKFLYYVIAVDSSHNKSQPSESVSVQIPDITPPVRPYIKNVKSADNSIIVEWVQNNDADLKGYDIYRSINDGLFVKLNAINMGVKETTYTDNKLQTHGTYAYYVIATDSASNKSLPSKTWTAINSNKGASALNDVTLKYNSKKKIVNLTWQHTDSERLLGYVIYRKEGEKGALVPISERVVKRQFTDKVLKTSTIYYYEIRAYDKAGNIERSEMKKISN